MIKPTLLALGVCCAFGITSALAQDDDEMIEPTEGYVGADGDVVRTGIDGCLRSGFWSEEDQINVCEGIEEPEPVAEVEPEPEPAPEPEPEPIARLVTQEVNEEAFFEFDSAELTSAGMAAMETLFAEVAQYEDVTDITVTGHTDSTGPEDYNMQLSERRAQTVADVLQEEYPDVRIDVQGRGESEPIATNETSEGRAQNRRVEVDLAAQRETFE